MLDHIIRMHADFYTPVDDHSLPTGEIRSVSGAMDLREPAAIGSCIGEADNGNGYDHNFCVSGEAGADGLRDVCRVYEPSSGRWMRVRSDQVGVQFYTGNYLDGSLPCRGGGSYQKHHGFCVETQRFPDSVNRPHFPNCVLRPGETYTHRTEHQFGCAAASSSAF